jgi:alkyl hydroperoxide reductase subunit F
MLDQSILEQISTLFADLDESITLHVERSDHAKQAELREMLADIAGVAPKVIIEENLESSPVPNFSFSRAGKALGIRFRAVPGGHEFSSLVLAILQAGGKGRWPDAGLQQRVRAIKGPVQVRTYVSLSCTNCPDVVQALNQMALLHPDFQHETIDGDLVPTEVQSLGIQGVPAVFAGDKLIHSGKAGFGELLETLEAQFGRTASAADNADGMPAAKSLPVPHWQTAIIGGGPAAVAAAIYLARKGVSVGIIADRIGGQVNDTLGIENLVAIASTQGPQLAADLRANLLRHPVTLLENRRVLAVQQVPNSQEFGLEIAGGEKVLAKQVIVASGAAWRQLNIPGEAAHIGRGVAFCPHCDGPFFAGKDIAVVGGGNSGIEAAIDLAGICRSVTVLEFLPQLKADQVLVDKAQSLANVRIHTNAKALEVLGDGSSVQGLRYQDRTDESVHDLPLAGIFVQIGLAPNSTMVKDLVQCNRGGEIQIDGHCRSSLPGIYAAGDVSNIPYKQIAIALGEGAKAALAAYEDAMRG